MKVTRKMIMTRKIAASLLASAALALLGGAILPGVQAQALTGHDRAIRQRDADLANVRRQEDAARRRPGFNPGYWSAQERKKNMYWSKQLSGGGEASEDRREHRQRDVDFRDIESRRAADFARIDRQEAGARRHPGYSAAYWADERKKKQAYYSEMEAQKKTYWNNHR